MRGAEPFPRFAITRVGDEKSPNGLTYLETRGTVEAMTPFTDSVSVHTEILHHVVYDRKSLFPQSVARRHHFSTGAT
jgi:hypothetical protein